MAGDWIKFEVNTPEKQEVLAITVAMGWDDPDMTVGKLLRVWRWFDQQTVDGNAPSVSAALLDRISGVSGFAQAMANVGWLWITPEGLSLPNFGRHNGKTAKERALTAKRVANHKANAEGNGESNADGNAGTVSGALPREEKRRKKRIKTLSGEPDVSRDQAKEVLNYLNAKAGKEFRLVDANLDMVAARLKEGATVADCFAVVDAKVLQWGEDEKMAEFLRPGTLFNRTKFAQYVGQGSTVNGTPWEGAV